MMNSCRIDIAEDFSDTPAGRYVTDGPATGEHFREGLLLEALKKSDLLEISLDGAEGYGSSFLEEAFGGAVRQGYFSAKELHDKIKFITDDPALEMEIWSYIDDV